MKKTIILALFAVLAMPSLTLAAFDTNLRYGSQGAQVLELQEFLTEQGVYTGPITGNFFALTLAGVKNFQTVHQVVPVSGYFGPITRGVASGILEQELAESDLEASTTPVVITKNNDAPRTKRRSQPSSMTPSPSAPTPPSSGDATPTPPAPSGIGRIDIVSISQSKSLDQTYSVAPESVHSWSEATDTNQFAMLGAIVYDTDGNNLRDADVGITASDAPQNVTLHGTGNLWGQPHNLFYYPFQYLFRSAGEHTVTFSSGGVQQSVTLNAE